MSDTEDTRDTDDASDGERTPAEIRAEIEQTRQQLGETAEALAAKTDVKGQARRAVDDAKATVHEKISDARESVTGAAGGAPDAAQDAAPQPVAELGTRLSRLIRENRPAVIAVGALLLGVMVGRRRPR